MTNQAAATFRLYLVRHARATWGAPGVSDFDRPLDEVGRAEARDVAAQAALSGLTPDMLVSSPALRCRQTTALFLDVFRSVRPAEDMALYSGGPDAYLALIQANAGQRSMMIVGHNPMIEALAHHLCGDSEILVPLAYGYPTAGLLAIDLPSPLTPKLAQVGQAVALIAPSLT